MKASLGEGSPEREPIEEIDRLIDTAFTETFKAMGAEIDSIYKEIGARVILGASYAGEQQETRFDIRPSPTALSQFMSDKPA
jgi:hypothetical protein